MNGLAQTMTFADLSRAIATPPGLGGVGVSGAALPIPPIVGKAVAQMMLNDVRDRFRTQTSPDGVQWKPLKHPRPRGGSVPLNDTGRLRASFTATTDATSVTISTAHPGAAVHNFGAIIRPKRRKRLAIPLTKEAQRAGSPRRFPQKLSLRPAGRNWLLVTVGPGGKEVGQYLLVSQVKIPARPFLGLSDKARDLVGRMILDTLAGNWGAT